MPGLGRHPQVRAIEAGLFDKDVVGKVAAVIIWVTPPHLERVTGDASWLDNAPRYDYGADGKLHHTGTFKEYRWTHPLDGLAYLARTHLQHRAAPHQRGDGTRAGQALCRPHRAAAGAGAGAPEALLHQLLQPLDEVDIEPGLLAFLCRVGEPPHDLQMSPREIGQASSG